MGRRDPYRSAPRLIGDEPITKVTDDWRVHARCRRCGHTGIFKRLASEAAARGIRTADEFKSSVVCSFCGCKDVLFSIEYVGLRRD